MTSLSVYVEVARVLAPSLITAAAVGVSASVVGVFALLRKEALAALAMPQVVAVGAAVGLRMNWPSLPPAIAAVVLAVIMLVWSKRRGANNWVLPSLYIAGLSISFLIIANSGAHVAELQAVFTGIDVAVSPMQAWIAAPSLLVAAIICASLWRRWLVLFQSPATAEAAGLHPDRWDAAFLSVMAIVLLVGTDALGAVMVVAMLFLPAAAALPWARRVPATLVAASILSIVFLATGIVLSVEWNLPLSQSVGSVGFIVMLISHVMAHFGR